MRATLPTHLFHGRLDDPTSLAEAAAALRNWEPLLDLVAIRDEPALFEPDGVLYGLLLAPATLQARHKPRRAAIGDLIVVPRAVGIEADPGFNLIGLLHAGIPPDHFRERFIQTWAYDHVGVAASPETTGGETIIGRDDVRYRIGYRWFWVGSEPVTGPVDPDLRIVIPLQGWGRLSLGGSGEAVDLTDGEFGLILPPARYQFQGEGRFGVIEIADEVSFAARRLGGGLESVISPSPESAPG